MEAVAACDCFRSGRRNWRLAATEDRQHDVSRTAAMAAAVCRGHVRAEFSAGALAAVAFRRTALQHMAADRHGGGQYLRWIFWRRRRLSCDVPARYLRRARHSRDECAEGGDGSGVHRDSCGDVYCGGASPMALLPGNGLFGGAGRILGRALQLQGEQARDEMGCGAYWLCD